MATKINTREFSRSPIPPMGTGSMAIVDTTGTIKINAIRLSSIPRALAARK